MHPHHPKRAALGVILIALACLLCFATARACTDDTEVTVGTTTSVSARHYLSTYAHWRHVSITSPAPSIESAPAPEPSPDEGYETDSQHAEPAVIVPAPAHEHPQSSTDSGGASGDGWEQLRQCESGSNYSSYEPPHYGAYQFALGTWASVGGSGNPADASPAEQDARAQRLYNARGASPWPNCGRYL